jgi:hypothetical protein
MRFTTDGNQHELTPALVRSRLAGVAPGEIRQYWVEIDGTRWPVKQVVRLATGSSEFQSQTAQRLLRKLGFVVGGDPVVRAGSSGVAKTVSHGAFDLDALHPVGSIDVRISFQWHQAGRITLDAAGIPEFPPVPRLPGLYRFEFTQVAEGLRRLYIGESEDLRTRTGQYRHAKKDGGRNRTSRRIHRELVAHLAAGGVVDFAITTTAQIDGEVRADLRLKSARRLAENAAVLIAQTTLQVDVLNIDADLADHAEGQ